MKILFVSYNYTIGKTTFGFGNVQFYRSSAPQDIDDLNKITKLIEKLKNLMLSSPYFIVHVLLS